MAAFSDRTKNALNSHLYDIYHWFETNRFKYSSNNRMESYLEKWKMFRLSNNAHPLDAEMRMPWYADRHISDALNIAQKNNYNVVSSIDVFEYLNDSQRCLETCS